MADRELEAYFARLGAEAGTPALSDAEADEVLDLTRVVAHTVERRYAPLAAYAAGLAIGTATDPAQRATRVREILRAVRRLSDEDRT